MTLYAYSTGSYHYLTSWDGTANTPSSGNVYFVLDSSTLVHTSPTEFKCRGAARVAGEAAGYTVVCATK